MPVSTEVVSFTPGFSPVAWRGFMLVSTEIVSLTPGFSPVAWRSPRLQPFQRLSFSEQTTEKPLKRLFALF